MEVVLADTAGFCFGVKRAVDKVYEALESGRKIYTLGPIIHNDMVVSDLENKGVITLKDETELDRVEEGGLLVIRSHGVGKVVIQELETRHIEYIDMTCPFVKRIHNLVSENCDSHKIVITGSKTHPEVIGIMGWNDGESIVIETTEEAAQLTVENDENIFVVSQTTFNFNKFQEFIELFKNKGYNVNVVNTICDATRKRQLEAADIASKVDSMIVIGDIKSSNSKKLFDICSKYCENTYFVQTLSDLKKQMADKHLAGNIVGITAGASTPNNIIRRVQNYVRTVF